MDALADAAHFAELDRRFEAALAGCTSGPTPVSVLFSGGVDSALLAAGLRAYAPVRLITIGTPRARDPAIARGSAERLGIPVEIHAVSEREIASALDRGPPRLRELREPMRSVQLALAIALRSAPDRIVVVGQGADELFGGYAHFRDLVGERLDLRRQVDWARLREQDWPLSIRVAEELGKELRSPYMDDGFSHYARTIPLESVTRSEVTKPFFRRWALHRGLPSEIVSRPKLAMQYGSGVARVVDRSRRAQNSPAGAPVP